MHILFFMCFWHYSFQICSISFLNSRTMGDTLKCCSLIYTIHFWEVANVFLFNESGGPTRTLSLVLSHVISASPLQALRFSPHVLSCLFCLLILPPSSHTDTRTPQIWKLNCTDTSIIFFVPYQWCCLWLPRQSKMVAKILQGNLMRCYILKFLLYLSFIFF